MHKKPTSAYRLQLSEKFDLFAATAALDFLADLGIDAIYTSPLALAHSSHGYDSIDPNRLNPSLGTEKEFAVFLEKLQRLNLQLILDIVPNHMGICGGNAWWEDLLKHGPKSKYASFFDVEWNPEKPELKGRVLLPILGKPYGTVLKRGEIVLHHDKKHPYLTYHDYHLPISPKTYSLIPKRSSAARLDKLLEAQHYRLAYWKVAAHEINYRRFFNIHELAALRIEDENVLNNHHRWIFDLVKKGKVQGLRVDHPDGLYDPETYFKRLQKNQPIFTVVEKILDREEELPSAWKVDGTVGYEYLNLLTALFVDKSAEGALTHLYEEFLGCFVNYEEVVYQAKKYFTQVEMVSEVEALGLALDRLSEHDPVYRDFTRIDLTAALAEVIACFPIYRTYIAPKGKVSQRDADTISIALCRARLKGRNLDPSIFDFLEKLFLLQLPHRSAPYRDFILRFQQLTGPLMAKGVEDTAFYRYNRFIALNEVGGDPKHFGASDAEFHAFNQKKLEKWPHGFLASSTHDTKRSEDVRMRLAVLSEHPKLWEKKVKNWSRIAAHLPRPSRNTEYYIYQTLIGSWPISFDRLWKVILKSLREAKEETSWTHPDEAYEGVVYHFVQQLLESGQFLADFIPFQMEVDRLGHLNSLSATTLKLGSPGVFELYQENERFTYRLVDPDNRAPLRFSVTQDEKERVTQIGLRYRQKHPKLFLQGEYIPLETTGNLIAFARRYKEQRIIVAAARFFSTWEGGEIYVPKEWEGETFFNLFSENAVQIKGNRINLPKEEPIGFYERS